MEFESTHSNTTAKLPILKLGEYEMCVIRIKQYFQVQDYALWEVIANGNSWVSVPQTAQENGTSVTKMSVPVTAEEKTNKKNDVMARSLLLMALPNEHQLSFKSLDSIFNRLQKIVSWLAILGVVITQEDLNSIFLTSLPLEWNAHVLVWMNKAEIETISIDDLYNNFKIVEQSVKKSVGASSGAQNLAFMSDLSTSSTNDVNTAKPAYEVSIVSTNVNTASPQDLEQIHEDNLEAMDLKWQLSLLSMRAKRYYQRTCKKIFINAKDTAGYDKSKVECFNCHKMGHFSRECRAPRNKEGQFRNPDNTRKQGNNEDTSSKAMLAINGVASKGPRQVVRGQKLKKIKRFGGIVLIPPPHPLIYNRPKKLDLSYSGLDEFKEPEFKGYGTQDNFKDLMEVMLHLEEEHCGRISGKGTLKTDSLDFEDVYFANELKFNLLMSHIYDCYKSFENWTKNLVACLKGKQHIASCKSKVLNLITKPLFMLRMDLFGLTFMNSLMHKKYCLVVTDDYSRFTWVFFLTTKDETSEILKNFIKEIENLVDKKVKIIRSDNGTDFKNKVIDDFCRDKVIRREYSIAKTPQQNGMAERRNRTLIEAARTMLADSKLPTTFWAEAVSTASYVQNRVLVVKPHNKTPYKLFRGFKPALSFMRPFGCHVTILNTLDSLGKFDGKSDEGPITNESAGTQRKLNAGISTQKEEISQDYIVMPIWKDASYSDSPSKDVGNGEPKSAADDQKQVEYGPDNENDEKDKSEDDSSPKEVNAAGQHSAFLYGTIEEEVYVTQPLGFKDLDHPDKVYKVVKALYGLHQAPRAWYETLDNYLLGNRFKRGKIDQTLFIKKQKGDILLVQVYVDDIIFSFTNKELCTAFEKLIKDKFQMSSMRELTFFLGLQVQQKVDGIFISQDKYVAEILKKFNYTDVKSASTLVDLEKPLVKDGDADDVDVHLYRSMIGSLMYLTASRPDIMDSPFELVAYTDSDYAGATQDRKSTTGGCQFLGNRLISWQCKKQTMVAASTTKAEYMAAANLLTKGFDAGRHVKRGLDTKIPQSSSPPIKVGDEAVHKELGDRMERAATTASSLEAEQDNGNINMTQSMATLNEPSP
ncbi:putative ribonuclease H-like domain-containing protein [Tanacetum coccineum]